MVYKNAPVPGSPALGSSVSSLQRVAAFASSPPAPGEPAEREGVSGRSQKETEGQMLLKAKDKVSIWLIVKYSKSVAHSQWEMRFILRNMTHFLL